MNRNFDNYDNSLYEMDMECMKEQQGGQFQKFNQQDLYLQNANHCQQVRERQDMIQNLSNDCEQNEYRKQKCQQEERASFQSDRANCPCEQNIVRPCHPKQSCECKNNMGGNSCLILLLLLCICGKK